MASTGTKQQQEAVFVKVGDLKPCMKGLNLIVKVLTSETVLQKRGQHWRKPQLLNENGKVQNRFSECEVGDDTGTILFMARGDQVDLMKPGKTVILHNARIDMYDEENRKLQEYRGTMTMRLAVNKWGAIEVTDPAKFAVEEDNNRSLDEYEYSVNV